MNADTALTLMIELKQRVIEQRGPRVFRLPRGFSGPAVVSVTPANAARRGREYFSPILAIGPRDAGCNGG